MPKVYLQIIVHIIVQTVGHILMLLHPGQGHSSFNHVLYFGEFVKQVK